jgi:hypothetical protein
MSTKMIFGELYQLWWRRYGVIWEDLGVDMAG